MSESRDHWLTAFHDSLIATPRSGHEEGADERKQSSRQSRKVYQQEAFGNRFETDPSGKNSRDDEKSSIVDGNGAASAGGDILEPKLVLQQDVEGILVGSVGLMCFPRLREHQRSH